MWTFLVFGGVTNTDIRLQSAGMFKNEYWFRVASVPDMHETSWLDQKQIHGGYCICTRTLEVKVTEYVQPTGYCFINVSSFTTQILAECNIENVALSSTFNHFARSTSTGAISPNSSTGTMVLSWTPITTIMFNDTSTVAIPPSRASQVSISSLLHPCVEIYINKTTSFS
jgi:hypothetical protein